MSIKHIMNIINIMNILNIINKFRYKWDVFDIVIFKN
jgi:hypothetical protein